MIVIKRATSQDKNDILSFCTNTFDWGDYIEEVWDFWCRDNRNGQLLVVKEKGSNKRIGVSHVALCPGRKSVWLEGIRVHPDYRRYGVATRLVEKMLEYGRQRGATKSYAIVSKDNLVSQQMMKNNGFNVISRWEYHAASKVKEIRSRCEARLASSGELQSIWKYLQSSRTYEASSEMYVSSWHWYKLDRKTLRYFIRENRIIVTGSPVVEGMAIINKLGYWSSRNILQVVYIDGCSKRSLAKLVSFAGRMYAKEKFERLQFFFAQSWMVTSSIMENIRSAAESEHFLLYEKVFTQ